MSPGPQITPDPTEDEAVAIVAALEGHGALWPRQAAGADARRARSSSWRFSGRWWSRPLPTRRDRPYR